MSFADDAARVVAELCAELERKQRERETRAPDAELRFAIERVGEMARSLEPDAGSVDTWPVLGRIVGDSWEPTAPLSQRVLALEDAFQRELAARRTF